jgi:hypothetical protein
MLRRDALSHRALYHTDRLLLGLLLSTAAWSGTARTTVMAQVGGLPPLKPPFTIRSYGGKCLDFGPSPQVSGAPVFINACNGTAAQQVFIEEVNVYHEVILRAGTLVIGVRSELVSTPGPGGPTQSETESPLELQLPGTFFTRGQRFALDGDSIILAPGRNRVVKVQNGRGRDRTPLVLGRRDLADAEFWTFTATNGSSRRPTSGFVRVSQVDLPWPLDDEAQARAAFINAVQHAGWGTVIELDPNVAIDLTSQPPLYVPAGVTIRGDRRGSRPGPLLKSLRDQQGDVGPPFPESDVGMLYVNGNHVRITGLRMQGPTRRLADGMPYANGIGAQDKFKAIIDHNEMFDWTAGAVTLASEPHTPCDAPDAPQLPDPSVRPQNIRVVRNFLHHNQNDRRLGYGVVTGGSNPWIEGNTFLSHYHAIAAGTDATSAYRAWSNLVLTASPSHGQDFDAHGTGSHGEGGCAGQYFEMGRNTFLGGGRPTFKLRGEPAVAVDFGQNVTGRSRAVAVECASCGDTSKLHVYDDNRFGVVPNPTSRLGVGDFDGDGTQDLFLATGASWYYSPGGKAEWRFLNAQSDGIGSLLFGDFDADGRTDVFTQHVYSWDVSWGGASRWENINVSWAILGNVAVGDFIGDERDDIFYADGQQWWVSDGGAGEFTPLASSRYRVISLRFGDFDANGRTDVFSVVDGYWKVSYGGITAWDPLREKLTDSVAGLVVADFDGDRRADVATSTRLSSTAFDWKVSDNGAGGWTTLRIATVPLFSAAAVGRFDGDASADVLLWHNNFLEITAGGAGTRVRHSRDDMR